VKGMPMHRISWETEREVADWAKDHYPYFANPKTFDEIIHDLVKMARALEKELEDRE
jgi:hypothetical protein